MDKTELLMKQFMGVDGGSRNAHFPHGGGAAAVQ